MRYIITFIFCTFVLFAGAQDKYKISLYNDVDLVEKQVDENVPVLKIGSDKDLRLLVRYRSDEMNYTNKMRRQYFLFDESDKELFSVQLLANEGRAEISLPKSALKKKQMLTLYTVSYPTDPELAAKVKLRRVKLALLSVE